MKDAVHKLLHSVGVDLVRFPTPGPIDRRQHAIWNRGVTIAIDGGANTGQYASMLRATGYEGLIVSFEPLAEPFGGLLEASAQDPLWEARQLALSNVTGVAEMNVAGNLYSSSLLVMGTQHLTSAPEARTVGTETVDLAVLDDQALPESGRVLLKLDVQGGEIQALKGAERLLRDRVDLLELEVSLVEVYDGQPLLGDVISYLRARSFVLVMLDEEWNDPETGELLQMNAFFTRC